MARLLRLSDRIFLSLAAIASAGYLVCVLAQVLYRYVLEAPLPWSEELARYLFVWTAMLAAAVSVGRADQFNIPMFADSLGEEARRWLEVFIAILGLIFALVIVWYGWQMSWRLMRAVSPVLPVAQGAVYLVIPIAGFYMAIHLSWRLYGLLIRRLDPKAVATW